MQVSVLNQQTIDHIEKSLGDLKRDAALRDAQEVQRLQKNYAANLQNLKRLQHEAEEKQAHLGPLDENL